MRILSAVLIVFFGGLVMGGIISGAAMWVMSVIGVEEAIAVEIGGAIALPLLVLSLVYSFVFLNLWTSGSPLIGPLDRWRAGTGSGARAEAVSAQLASFESELGLVPWRPWLFQDKLRGAFRGYNVRVDVLGDGSSSVSTGYRVDFDEQVVGPPGFRRVGWLGTHLRRSTSVDVGRTRFRADNIDELAVWLTDDRESILLEMTDRKSVKWRVRRNWRTVTLQMPGAPDNVQVVRLGLDMLASQIDELR